MSNELKGPSQASLDPEKGLFESQAVSYNGDVKASLSSTVSPAFPLTKEKDPVVTTTTKEVIVATKPSKPPSKPKKKVPLWIVWTLWFNTYRYIASFATTADRYLALHQEIFHVLFWLQHAWPYLSGIRAFPLWRYVLWCHRCCKFQHGNLNAQWGFRALTLFARKYFICQGSCKFHGVIILILTWFRFQWTPLWFRLGCTSVLQVSSQPSWHSWRRFIFYCSILGGFTAVVLCQE